MTIKSLSHSSLTDNLFYRSMLAGNTAYEPFVPTEYDLLASTTLDADAAGIEFSNLVSSFGSYYTDLQLRIVSRVDSATGGYVSASVNFNDDFGSNYAWRRVRVEGTAGQGNATTDAVTSDTKLYYGRVPRDGYTANYYWAGILDINDAFNTSKKTTILSVGGHNQSGNFFSGMWNNTDAIDTIFIDGDPGVGLKAGSRASLYGRTI